MTKPAPSGFAAATMVFQALPFLFVGNFAGNADIVGEGHKHNVSSGQRKFPRHGRPLASPASFVTCTSIDWPSLTSPFSARKRNAFCSRPISMNAAECAYNVFNFSLENTADNMLLAVSLDNILDQLFPSASAMRVSSGVALMMIFFPWEAFPVSFYLAPAT
jgi:hypothetical protein